MRAAVEYPRYRIISFLPAGVPEHHLEKALLVDVRGYRGELRAYGYFVILREGVRPDSFDDARLAHT